MVLNTKFCITIATEVKTKHFQKLPSPKLSKAAELIPLLSTHSMSHSPSKHSFLLSSFSWAFARLKRALTYLGLSSTAFVQSCATSVHFCCGQEKSRVRGAPLSSLCGSPSSRLTHTQQWLQLQGSAPPYQPHREKLPGHKTCLLLHHKWNSYQVPHQTVYKPHERT